MDPLILQSLQSLQATFQQLQAALPTATLVDSGSAQAPAPTSGSTTDTQATTSATSLPATQSNVAPAPRVSNYISPRLAPSAHGHPNPSTPVYPAAYQPILGTSSLAVSMTANTNLPRHAGSSRTTSRPTTSDISQANTNRNLAIDAHFPAPTSLQVVRRRRRGVALGTPTLPRDATSPASVFDTDPATNERFVNLLVHVYLPHPTNSKLHLVNSLFNSFDSFLDKHSLRFQYRLPVETTILSLIETVVNDMKNSSQQWHFPAPSSSLLQYLQSNETLPLQLLRIASRGIPRSSDGLITLARQPGDHGLALSRLFAHPYKVYSKSGLGVRNSRLVLNFVASSGASCLADPGNRDIIRRHTCLNVLMHSLFSAVNEGGGNISSWTPPGCQSDSEDEHDDEMDEVEDSLIDSDAANQPLNPNPVASTSSISAPLASASAISTLSPQTPAVPHTTLSVSPPQLWSSEWIPFPGRYRALFEAAIFSKAVFDSASSSSTITKFAVSGRDIHEVAMALIEALTAAAALGDFTNILSSDRVFEIVNDEGTVLSTGSGIEREAIYTAFRHFADHEGAWFLPRFGNKCSIATTMSLAGSSYISTDRRLSLSALGSVTALMLIHGIAPDPLSPALIQWAANSCDVNSLTRSFVGEWHPELRALLDEWLAMGPTGDITPFQSHFAIYHDMQTACLRSRDLPQHQALAVEMLYTALIGPQPSSHAELQAFVTGFKLHCRNGLDFSQVLRSFVGGSATFISRTWTSVIHDFESIQQHLSIFSLTRRQLTQFVDPTSPVVDMDLCEILRRFLQGSGAPCPQLLAEAMPRFSKLIPWDKIDGPAFRCMLFCWATTGSPHVEFSDLDMQMCAYWIGPSDLGYHDDPVLRNYFMQQGEFAFRTCFRVVRMPIIHLADICSRSYPALDQQGNEVEPYTREQAIDNWLLMQLLGAIGGHTIL